MLLYETSTMSGRLHAVLRHRQSSVLRRLMEGFGFELFGYPPYSPDFGPNTCLSTHEDLAHNAQRLRIEVFT